MARGKLFMLGLAALLGLAGAGCARSRYTLPRNPANCRSYIEEQVDGAYVRYYEGIEEGGNALYARIGRRENVYWDNPPNEGVDVFAVQRIRGFGLNRDTTTFLPNPGQSYTNDYSRWLAKIRKASRAASKY